MADGDGGAHASTASRTWTFATGYLLRAGSVSITLAEVACAAGGGAIAEAK